MVAPKIGRVGNYRNIVAQGGKQFGYLLFSFLTCRERLKQRSIMHEYLKAAPTDRVWRGFTGPLHLSVPTGRGTGLSPS